MGGEAKKRPFGATIRTFNDLSNGIGSWADDDDDTNAENNDTSNGKINIQHIPNLPNDNEASKILRRIHYEFKEIIERRKFNVISLTEMCCCGDGKDHCGGSTKKRGRSGRRKTKIMPNNVLGYNLTASSSYNTKRHEIHLRLRHPRTHELLDYESIAGTMCHELAHCVRGPHDAIFYKAMNEIEDQYAVYLTKGVVLDKDGFPIGSANAHVLGGGGGGIGSKTAAAAAAAESRRKKNGNGLTQGYVLGGKRQAIPKDPREAARIAAERRLLDSKFCLPCNEVIEILGIDSSSSDEESDDDDVILLDAAPKAKKSSVKSKQPKVKSRDDDALDLKPKAVACTTTSNAAMSSDDSVIDLTEDSFDMTASSSLDDLASASVSSSAAPSRPKQTMSNDAEKHDSSDDTDSDNDQDWACPKCTLHNTSIVLVCTACHSERPTSKRQHQKLRNEEISYIKRNEVDQSRRTFNGFNVYGNKTNPSLTMNHLT